jgi:hypothetical protein
MNFYDYQLSFMGMNPASVSRRTSTTTMEGEPKSASTRGDLNSSYISKASSEDRMNLNNSLRQSNEENPFEYFGIDLSRVRYIDNFNNIFFYIVQSKIVKINGSKNNLQTLFFPLNLLR